MQGIIAGKMTKTGVLGYLGSFPIPEVVSGINAAMLGAQRQPELKVKMVWIEHLVRSRQGSRRRQDADRPGRRRHHAAHRQPGAVADRRGARQVRLRPGFRHVMFGPKAHLTSIDDNWGPYYIERVKEVLDGTWKSATWGGFEDQAWSRWRPHQHARRREEAGEGDRSRHQAGKLHPFKCPVVDQDGKEVECEGNTHLDDKQVLGMNFYVKGIDEKNSREVRAGLQLHLSPPLLRGEVGSPLRSG